MLAINIKIIKKHKKIVAILLFILLFILYTIFMILVLGIHSDKLEKQFNQENLEGKNIKEAIRILGKPAKIESEIDYINDKNFNLIEGDNFFRLTYYTDNPILNFIGWFPCGGTKIFVDNNSKVTGFKTWCY